MSLHSERVAEDRLTNLPEELRILIVEAATVRQRYVINFALFSAVVQNRLAVIQVLRLLNTTFSRMRKTREALYDATSQLWAAKAAIKASLQPSTHPFDMTTPCHLPIEMALYTKEREAYFAVVVISRGDIGMSKDFLSYQKRRKPLVDAHLKELGVYN